MDLDIAIEKCRQLIEMELMMIRDLTPGRTEYKDDLEKALDALLDITARARAKDFLI